MTSPWVTALCILGGEFVKRVVLHLTGVTVVQEVEKSFSNQKVARSIPCQKSVLEQDTEPLIAPDAQCALSVIVKCVYILVSRFGCIFIWIAWINEKITHICWPCISQDMSFHFKGLWPLWREKGHLMWEWSKSSHGTANDIKHATPDWTLLKGKTQTCKMVMVQADQKPVIYLYLDQNPRWDPRQWHHVIRETYPLT